MVVLRAGGRCSGGGGGRGCALGSGAGVCLALPRRCFPLTPMAMKRLGSGPVCYLLPCFPTQAMEGSNSNPPCTEAQGGQGMFSESYSD